MALSLDVEVGESVHIGEAVITLVHKTGRKARISIDVDRNVPVSLNHSKTQQKQASAESSESKS